jgi:predicted dehydrogenase
VIKKYVLVGAGGRGCASYVRPLTELYTDCALLCGIYDINRLRAEATAKMAAYEVPVFEAWDEMLAEARPDVAIVTTVDATHDKYVIGALEAGCDVISEKPLTTDEKKLNAIRETANKTKKNVSVIFNCRFVPVFMRVKELLLDGAVGDIFSAHYEWMLDTSHGADYFRRWHRERKNSGSLLIHKASHHFDLLNWYLNSDPAKVNAFGSRRFYGTNQSPKAVNCRSCEWGRDCNFYWDITADAFNKKMYADCEGADGYLRDGCVFSDEIDIEDTLSLSIKYKSGASAAYSLTAHSPYEGLNLVINGSGGRLELKCLFGSGFYAGAEKSSIKLYNRYGEEVCYNIPPNHVTKTMLKSPALMRNIKDSGHGGSDGMLRNALFRGMDQDPINQLAGLKEGAMSVGIGIAANISMREDRAVRIDEFLDI